MSKYDFDVDLSHESSTGIILGGILPGSIVLEFGCATGRMTRYMKEALACSVYIVEYEKEAFEKALPFAVDGLCDDISTFQWQEKFGDIKFDAIIFADVLEHLVNPQEVLKAAATLLKETGKVYISIPNITHNDVLLRAVDDCFNYTATGILDDTHIHFWGKNNLQTLVENSGLTLRKLEATYCKTGETEQFGTERPQLGLLENLLRERESGEVYQFILTLDKNAGLPSVSEIRKATIKSHIYLDTGKGITPEEIITFDSPYYDNGYYHAYCEINPDKQIQSIRFDPIELQGCILENLSITQNGEDVSFFFPPEMVPLKKGVFLPGDDPMVFSKKLQPGKPIVIEADILLAGDRYLKIVSAELKQKADLFEQELRETVSRLTNEFAVEREQLISALRDCEENYSKNIETANEQNRKMSRTIGEQAEQIETQNKEIKEQKSQIEVQNLRLAETERELGAYVILCNRKELRLIEVENWLENEKHEKESVERVLQEYLEQLARERQEKTKLQMEISRLQMKISRNIFISIEPLRKVYRFGKRVLKKMYSFVRRILGGIKRRIKKLIGRG